MGADHLEQLLLEGITSASTTMIGSVGHLANALTAVAIVAGFVVTRRPWIRGNLVRARRRAFRRSRHAPRIPRKLHSSRVKALTTGAASATAADELNWLCSGLPGPDDAALTQQLSPAELRGTAKAYRRLAAELDGRLLLSSRVDAIAQQRDLASVTAHAIEHHVATGNGGAAASLELDVPHRATQWQFLAFPGYFKGHMAFDLSIAYRNHLRAVDYDDSPWRSNESFVVSNLPVTEVERSALLARRDEGHFFDGVLPRLTHAQAVRDHSSGRARLTLSLAGCTYFAVVTDHYPGERQLAELAEPLVGRTPKVQGVRQEPVSGAQVGVLTLALLPITADDFVVFTERGFAAGSHQGLFGPGVNGNLELQTRQGVRADADEFGLPDPLRALAREAREELGLDLGVEDINTLGLARFDSPTERGTNVLLTTVRLPLTLEQVVADTRRADLIEGRWELGGTVLGMRLPSMDSSDEEVHARAAWLLNSPRLTPHATAAGLAALAAYRGERVWRLLSEEGPVSGDPDSADWLRYLVLD
jgi:hypothetical protein